LLQLDHRKFEIPARPIRASAWSRRFGRRFLGSGDNVAGQSLKRTFFKELKLGNNEKWNS